MAEGLSHHAHEVILTSTVAAERSHPKFDVRRIDEQALRQLDRWMDVLVFQGGLLHDYPFLQASEKVIVADIYDPFHLENLEQTSGLALPEGDAVIRHLTGVLNDQLLRGDLFLCASRRQRDFWLGGLAALGRINPWTYAEDQNLESLMTVVPFGLPGEAPVQRARAMRGVVPGIGLDDKVVLWAGGVYNWFDPCSLVLATDRLRNRMPEVRVFFMGMQHPNPHIPAMRAAVEVRDLSTRLGLTGKHVFFNDIWVDYDQRADYLLDADVGVSMHLQHIETAFSFRTRILDYLWAGLPIVLTEGDSFAELVAAEGLGATVPPGDPEAIEDALYRVLNAPPSRDIVRGAAEPFRWRQALRPLIQFCQEPRRAPDLVARARLPLPEPGRAASAPNRLVARYREGGARGVVQVVRNRWARQR
jgi:glycosyltransferase involved in cell wall biosynthesis